jgi:hypothetical protein
MDIKRIMKILILKVLYQTHADVYVDQMKDESSVLLQMILKPGTLVLLEITY